MRFVPWCVALAVALAASPAAFAQKKAAKKPPAPKPVHMPAPKPVHMPAPKPVHMPAPKPNPHPAPAAKPNPPRPKTVKPTPAAKPNANASAAQRRQAETARAEAMIRAGQLPRSARTSRPGNPRVATAGRSATPSRLVPSSGTLVTASKTGLVSAPLITMSKNGLMSAPRITMSKNGLASAPLITMSKNGLASAPLITQTPIPALSGLAKAPRITPTAVKTNALIVQNPRKEVVVVPRYVGRGYGHRYSGYRHGRGYGYGRGYRSYARFRRPYRNPNAASQALYLQRLEQLRADLDQVRQSRAVPSEALRARIGDDLLAIARSKPTGQEAAAIRQLGDDLSLALRGHPGPIPPTSDLVLALNQVVNHRRMTPEAVDRSIQEGRMALQAWRVSLPRVSKLVQDLRAVGGVPSLASAAIAP